MHGLCNGAAAIIRRLRIKGLSVMARKNTVLDVPSEHVEQREFVKWFRREFKEIRIFAIPNGGHRNKAIALKLKLEGVSPGVPDLFIPAWGLWIEMKPIKGGSVSESQEGWHSYLVDHGYKVFVCRGCEEAKKVIENFPKTP